MRTKYVLALGLFIFGGLSQAALIGPGDVATAFNDNSYALMIVDLNNPVTLAAGNYTASLFSYQFTGANSLGQITPVLVTGSGSNWVPIAIGSALTSSGSTAYTSSAFGGTNAFSLGASTAVYAGMYWNTTGGTMPVGFQNGVGSSYVFYGSPCNCVAGASAPALRTAEVGTYQSAFGRTYDFAIQVDPVNSSATPEPATLTLFAAGFAALYALRRR